MRKSFHVVSVVLFIIVIFGSVWAYSATALEQGPIGEVRLFASDPIATGTI
jgi:hypothetical protein